MPGAATPFDPLHAPDWSTGANFSKPYMTQPNSEFLNLLLLLRKNICGVEIYKMLSYVKIS